LGCMEVVTPSSVLINLLRFIEDIMGDVLGKCWDNIPSPNTLMLLVFGISMGYRRHTAPHAPNDPIP
jgi:hypothetical protein